MGPRRALFSGAQWEPAAAYARMAANLVVETPLSSTAQMASKKRSDLEFASEYDAAVHGGAPRRATLLLVVIVG